MLTKNLKVEVDSVQVVIKNLPGFKFLQEQGIVFRVIELSRPPESASDIVAMFGCPLSAVIKTLLLVGDKNILVCVPGDRRVSVAKLLGLFEIQKLRMANRNEVREITGFDAGGVCPFFKTDNVSMVLDKKCLMPERINIGAGSTTVGLELSSQDLVKIWWGTVADVTE